MAYSLSDYITFEKSGLNYRFSCSISNEGKTYRLLRQMGYCRTRENDRIVYFKLQGDDKEYLDMSDIRRAFRNFIVDTEFIDKPADLDIKIALNWLWGKKSLVRENELFKYYLSLECS